MPSGSSWGWLRTQSASTMWPKPGASGRRHQAALDDHRLGQWVVHGVDAGERDAPFDGPVGVAQRSQDLGVDVREHVGRELQPRIERLVDDPPAAA